MPRAAMTLIFASADRVARLDADGAGRHRLGWSSAARPAGQTLVQAVEAALEGSRCGRSVWLLSDEVWTQELVLSRASVANLSSQQLVRALGFELESLSGLGPDDADLAFVPLHRDAEQARYWVAQIAVADRQAVAQAIRAAGGRLKGIVHPGGLPRPLDGNDSANTDSPARRRVEVWPDVTFCVAPGDDPAGVHLINGSPVQQGWSAAVGQWLNTFDEPVAELLLADAAAGSAAAGRVGLTAVRRLDGELLEQWLARWVAMLSGAASAAPVIRPTARAATGRRYVAAAILLAALALAGVWTHARYLQQRLAGTWQQVRQAEQPRRQAAILKQRAAVLTAQLAELERGRPAAAQTDPTADLDRQRRRISVLLTALSQSADEDHVITALRSESRGGVIVEGLCLSPEAADLLAVRLESACRGSGWRVGGAQKTAQLRTADGGPWAFAVAVLPPDVATAAAATATAMRRAGSADAAETGGRIERGGAR